MSIESVPPFNLYHRCAVCPRWKRTAEVELGYHQFPPWSLLHSSQVVTSGIGDHLASEAPHAKEGCYGRDIGESIFAHASMILNPKLYEAGSDSRNDTWIHIAHLGFYLARLTVNLQSEIFSHIAGSCKLNVRCGIAMTKVSLIGCVPVDAAEKIRSES